MPSSSSSSAALLMSLRLSLLLSISFCCCCSAFFLVDEKTQFIRASRRVGVGVGGGAAGLPPLQFVAGWSLGPEEMCARPAAAQRQPQQRQQQLCNAHNSLFKCACPLASSGDQQLLPPPILIGHRSSCRNLLPPVERPNEELLTIGLAFPLMDPFLEDPEGIFLEDLELFTFIPKKSVLIYGRGCSSDSMAYEFTIGIVEKNGQLRSLHPHILLNNPMFMQQNALKVAYVQKGMPPPPTFS